MILDEFAIDRTEALRVLKFARILGVSIKKIYKQALKQQSELLEI